MTRPIQRSGRCTICSSDRCREVETLVLNGAGFKAVAAKFGLSDDAVQRHMANHVSPTRKALLLAGPIPIEQLAERAAHEGQTVLDQLRHIRSALYKMFDNCVEAGDKNGISTLASRLHDNLGLTAKLSGDLVKYTAPQTQINIFQSPAFAEMQGALIRALAAHPAARIEVIRAFRDLENRAPLIEATADAAS